MEEKDYLMLLEKAYADLPAVIYKKERFEVPQVSGRLIKSRTVITNFRDITKHLARNEDHFLKFMLREVGVRGDVSPKGELTLHSRFQPAILNKAVDNYFKFCVQCVHCASPDTVLTNENTIVKCNACGHQEKIDKL